MDRCEGGAHQGKRGEHCRQDSAHLSFSSVVCDLPVCSQNGLERTGRSGLRPQTLSVQ
jgi:hypothetical protein